MKIWDIKKDEFVNTSELFCGLFMGDYSKSGINTFFNTGTVVGVSTNIYGAGFPQNFLTSFSWRGHDGFVTYQFQKAKEVAALSLTRRKAEFVEAEDSILNHLFDITRKYRAWEK